MKLPRHRALFLIGGAFVAAALSLWTDPDAHGLSTLLGGLALIQGIWAVAAAHWGRKALTDYPEADQRQYRPYPPGNLLVNGSAYPEWIDGLAELSVSWAHRDRLLQTAYLVTQGEASIGPEAGTTYTLSIYGETDTLLHRIRTDLIAFGAIKGSA